MVEHTASRRPSSEQLASGVMDMLVLRVVSEHETYGYEIAQSLEVHGLSDVNEASVYTSAKRLEKNGLLSSRRELAENGRARRYYAVTQDGRHELQARLSTWDALSKVVSSVFASGEIGVAGVLDETAVQDASPESSDPDGGEVKAPTRRTKKRSRAKR